MIANRFRRDFLLVVLRVIFLFPFIFSGERKRKERANEKKSGRKKGRVKVVRFFLIPFHFDHHHFPSLSPSSHIFLFLLFQFLSLLSLSPFSLFSLFPCSENFHLVICKKMALLFPSSRIDTLIQEGRERGERKNERGQKICMKLKNYSSVFQFVNPEPSEKARK